MISRKVVFILFAFTGAFGPGCAMLSSHETVKPISNPFLDYRPEKVTALQNMILRTTRGDRSIELQIPNESQGTNDFSLPSSASGDARAPASISPPQGITFDESYKGRTASTTDRELAHKLPQGLPEDLAKREDIEQGLNLVPADETASNESTPSYLAGRDRIKQLYRAGRFEAAIIEADEMIRKYQTDPRLYEMRGTLLERLGERNLAIKSWNQALRFDPKNKSLERFLKHKPQVEGSP